MEEKNNTKELLKQIDKAKDQIKKNKELFEKIINTKN